MGACRVRHEARFAGRVASAPDRQRAWSHANRLGRYLRAAQDSGWGMAGSSTVSVRTAALLTDALRCHSLRGCVSIDTGRNSDNRTDDTGDNSQAGKSRHHNRNTRSKMDKSAHRTNMNKGPSQIQCQISNRGMARHNEDDPNRFHICSGSRRSMHGQELRRVLWKGNGLLRRAWTIRGADA